MQRLLTKGIGHTQFKDSPLGEIAESWETAKLGTLATFSQGIQVNVEEQLTSPKEGYIRFIRIVDYTQQTSDIRYVGNFGERYFAKKGDIVMIRYGTPGLIGRGIEGIIANNMFKINFNSAVDNDFAEHFLSYSDTQRKIKDGSGSSTMPAINFSFLKTLDFVLPPIAEQKEIAIILKVVDEKLKVLQQRKSQVSELKKGLMQQLLTGKLRVNSLIEKEVIV